MNWRRMSFLLVLLAVLLCLASFASAKSLFSLSRTGIEETWATGPDSTLNYQDLVNGNVYIDGYDSSLGEAVWTLTKTSGPADILRIENNMTTGDDIYVEFSENAPAPGDYAYTLSCTWQGETQELPIAVHVVEVSFTENLTLDKGASGELTIQILGSANPPSISWSYMTTNLEDGATRYGNTTDFGLHTVLDGNTLTLTAVDPGYYSVTIYAVGDSLIHNLAVPAACVEVLDEAGNSPEFDFSFSQEDLELTEYLKESMYLTGDSVPDGYTSNVRLLPSSIPAEWTLEKVSGPADIMAFEENSGNIGRSLVYTVDKPEAGTYVYNVSCTLFGTTRTRKISITFAEPPMGYLQGIVKPETLTVPLNGTASVTPVLNPEGWYLPDMDGNWYCYIYDASGNSYYNGNDLDGISAAVSDGTFTFTGKVPGYYRITYCYSCGDDYAEVSSTLIVLNEDGTRPAFDFRLGQEDYDGTYYINANVDSVEYDSISNGYTSIQGMVPEGERVVWELKQTGEGQDDILSLRDDGSSSQVMFAVSRPPVGTYTYTVSATILGTTRTRNITLKVVEPPNGPLNGVEKVESLELKKGEEKEIQVKLDPENWTLPGETPSVVCYVSNGSDNVYGGSDTTLTAEASGTTVRLKAFKSGVYTVSYSYSCSNFYAFTSFLVTVPNEDGSTPEWNYRLNSTEYDLKVYLTSASMQGRNLNGSYFSIWNYQDITGESPVWSIKQTSAPEGAGDPVNLEVYRYDYQGSHDGTLRFNTNEPAVGDYTYEISCSWMGTVRTASYTIHIMESPKGYLNGVTGPDTVSVGLNETKTAAFSTDPEGWTIPGERAWWNVSVYDSTGSWLEPENNACVRASVNNEGVCSLTGITPGYYRVYVSYNCAGAGAGKDFQVVVLNEDGSTPPFTFSLERSGLETNYYLMPNWEYTQTYVNGSWNSIGNYQYSEDAVPAWDLVFVSGPAENAFLINVYDGNRSTELYASSNSVVAGDYVYDLNCLWKGTTVTARYTIHVIALDQAVNGCNGETLITVPLKGSQSTAYTLDPEGWGIEGEEAYWSAYISDPETGNQVSGSMLQYQMNDNVLSLTGLKSGAYRGSVAYHCANIHVYKSVRVIVLNEDGSEPDNVLGIEAHKRYDFIAVNNASYSYLNQELAYAYIPDGYSMGEKPVWTLSTPDGTDELYRLETYDGEYYASVRFAKEPMTEGDYSLTLSVTFMGRTETFPLTYKVQDIKEPDQVVYPNDEACVLSAGETITLTKPTVVPADWTCNGKKPAISMDIRNYDDTPYNGLTVLEENDTSVTVQAQQPGSYGVYFMVDAYAFHYDYETQIMVRQPDGSLPFAVNVNAYYSTEDNPCYLGGSDHFFGDVDIRSYNLYRQVYEGNPVLTFTMDNPGVTVKTESYISGNYWQTSFMLEDTPEEDFDLTISWTITWGSQTQTGTLKGCFRMPDQGILRGISFAEGDVLTVKAGEPAVAHIQLNPEGWTLEGRQPEVTDVFCGAVDDYTVDGLTVTVVPEEPGYYTLEAIVGIANIHAGESIALKVTDAEGNLEEPEPLTIGFNMNSTYVLGDTVPLVYSVNDAIGGFKEYSETLYMGETPIDPVRDYDEVYGAEVFAPTAAGSYRFVISATDKLGRSAAAEATFTVMEPSALVFDGISLSGSDKSITAFLDVSGGRVNPTVTVNLYQGSRNEYRVVSEQAHGPVMTFWDLEDGKYLAVATATDGESSITLSSAWCVIYGGAVKVYEGTLNMPASLTAVEEEAFTGLQASEVVFADGLETIGSKAFKDAYVTSLVLPASVTSIAEDAFEGCSKYLTVTAPAGSYAAAWAQENGYLLK